MFDIVQEKEKLFIKSPLGFFGELLITSLKMRRKKIVHRGEFFNARRSALPLRKGPMSLPVNASVIDSCSPLSSAEVFLDESGPLTRFLGIFMRIKSLVVSTDGVVILCIYSHGI
ncbi:MAG: hypothetical protein Q7K44_02090 [Candidatus Liptonbacteria bacterium]|nr:hypothetical protein [Candidatus Liptonbacteria bacterium]